MARPEGRPPGGAPGDHRPYFKQVALHVPADLEHRLPFRILRVGREQYTARYPVFRGRALDCHHLLYVEQGAGRLTYGKFRGTLTAGTLVALCEGVPHDLAPQPQDPMEITWIVMHGRDFPRLAAAAGLTTDRPCVAIGGAAEPRAIFREIRFSGPGDVWHAYALVWTLLARAAAATRSVSLGAPLRVAPVPFEDAPGRPVAPPPVTTSPAALAADDPAIARAVEAIRMHLREPHLGVDHLARAAALGRSRFSQRFRRATGISPMAFLERVRMEEARRLLEDGFPVSVAARDVGFEDPLYFSRRFRRMHGVPPAAYRAVAVGARPPAVLGTSA